MPNPKNNIARQQWQKCDRCGFLFPMSDLQKQKGMLLDQKCIDNLTVERRAWQIMNILGQNQTEGVDTRVADRGFYEGFDEVNR